RSSRVTWRMTTAGSARVLADESSEGRRDICGAPLGKPRRRECGARIAARHLARVARGRIVDVDPVGGEAGGDHQKPFGAAERRTREWAGRKADARDDRESAIEQRSDRIEVVEALDRCDESCVGQRADREWPHAEHAGRYV